MLGILLANITAFSNPELAYYWPPALPGGANEADGWLWLAQFTLVDGKLRGMFAILFGAGLVMFVERGGDGAAAVVRQVRRLVWLALFGLAHFYLLFTGDVLFAYATSGLIALFALGWSARNLLVAGIFWGLAGGLLLLGDFAPAALIEMQAMGSGAVPTGWPALQDYWAQNLAEAEAHGAAMAGNSFPELLRYRWQMDSARLGTTLTYNFLETIPLILIGMGLFRAGIFSRSRVRRRWRGLAWAGVVLGAGMNAFVGWQILHAGFPPYQTQAAFFGLLPLCNLPLLLGAAVLLNDWALGIRKRWLGDRLALAGRMAFTNYIGTSLVMALVFQGWAGGLFGTMHRAELLLIVVMGWAMMLTGSRLWLGADRGRFRFGPLEWLWRCLTYGRFFPNRL